MAPELKRRLRTGNDERPYVTDESLVLRSYDGTETHEVSVRLLDADDDVAFDRTYTLSPLSVVTVATRLDRGVYRVDATVDDDTDHAECLIGSGPDETALVEVGNGLVSVAEGVV